jgi:hypothetical protein
MKSRVGQLSLNARRGKCGLFRLAEAELGIFATHVDAYLLTSSTISPAKGVKFLIERSCAHVIVSVNRGTLLEALFENCK